MSSLEQCHADLRRAVARIECLEKWFVPKIYECCGALASGDHSATCPLYGAPDLTTPYEPCGIYFPDSDRYEIALEAGATFVRHVVGTNVYELRRMSDGALVGLGVECAKATFEWRSFDKAVGDAVRKIDAEWNA